MLTVIYDFVDKQRMMRDLDREISHLQFLKDSLQRRST